jgi:hypothetical protein
MSIPEIKTSFASALSTLLPAATIVFENQAFDEEAQAAKVETWYKATFLPGEPEQFEIMAGGLMRHPGIFQVDCFRPLAEDGDDEQLASDAQAVVAAFAQGTTVGEAVTEKAWASEFIVEDDTWARVMVRVRWFADLAT